MLRFVLKVMNHLTRCATIVLDSGGVGALPDAAEYGDCAAVNTIANTARCCGGLSLANFERLGLGNLTKIEGVRPQARPRARVARLRERSRGKDTITGHWEMMGIVTSVPFPTYPHGFPTEIIEEFTRITGKAPLGNKTASGTEIVEELGAEHMATGRPILYTSADSVFQVATHEEIVPIQTLYDWCSRARAMLVPPNRVNRVIARPFIGSPGAFERTANRRDYAVEPPPSLLDEFAGAGVPVHAVGKISDIFCGRGISSSTRVADNHEAMQRTIELLQREDRGFIFTNLNDFDSKYGHRRDVRGYARALQALDAAIPLVEAAMRPGDALIFTADHGCDPTAPGSDHTREYAPFLHVSARSGEDLGELDGFDTIGKTVRETLEV